MMTTKDYFVQYAAHLPSLNLKRVEAFTPRNEVSVSIVVIMVKMLKMVMMIMFYHGEDDHIDQNDCDDDDFGRDENFENLLTI